jgi:YVTN family beta-propeller protein
MEFRILGPLEVLEDGRQVDLGGAKQRALLAILLLHANEVVSTDRLIDALWEEEPPETAQKALQVYVSHLRKALGRERVETKAPGYRLRAAEDEFDLERFQILAETDPREALALWRGQALAEFAYHRFAQSEIVRLEELRLACLERRIEDDLEQGRQGALVGELERLVREHPLRERLRAQLMLALYRSGRQAEALAAYRDARRALRDELGLEPSAELRELERRILAQDEALALQAGGPEAAVPESTKERASRKGRRRRILVTLVVALLLVAGAGVAAVELGGSGGGTVVALPGSVALIDSKSNHVVDAIPVGDRPTQIAIHGDHIWILHPDTRSLTLVGRAEQSVLRSVGLGGAPSSIAADGHGVWVTDARTGTVTLIEPERLTVVRTVKTRQRSVPLRDSDAGQIAIGFGSLWFASGGSAITRIDTASGRVMTRITGVDTGESLGGITFGSGSVWIAGPVQESMVTRIDPRRNSVVARIFIQKFRLNGVAFGGGGLWVSDVGSDQVWLIDPVNNAPVGTTKVGGQPLGVTYAAGSIWVANSGDGTVSRIDAVSRRVVATIPVGGSPNGIAATPDGIWVTVD